METYTALRSFKDFLTQYNQISESCFLKCVDHLSSRELSDDEVKCAELCTKKHVNVNHKVMQVYMEIQPEIVNKRINDMNKQQVAVEESKKQQIETEISKSIQEKPSNSVAGTNDLEKSTNIDSSQTFVVQTT